MKFCPGCKCNKQTSDFCRNARTKDGLNRVCRNCKKSEQRRYRENNKEKVRKNKKQYAIENKNKIKAYKRRYYIDNKEKINKNNKIHYNENKENSKNTQKKWRQNNIEKIRRNNKINKKKKLKEDEVFKLRETVSNAIRRYFKKNGHSKGGSSTWKFLPYSPQELCAHIEKQFEFWMSWDNYGVYDLSSWNDNDPTTWTWQLDHIIPHSTFKYLSMDDEEFKKCWALDNLRPLSAKENCIDGATRVRHIRSI